MCVFRVIIEIIVSIFRKNIIIIFFKLNFTGAPFEKYVTQAGQTPGQNRNKIDFIGKILLIFNSSQRHAMQSIQATPAMQLAQANEAEKNRAAHAFAQALARQSFGPRDTFAQAYAQQSFEARIPLTVEDLEDDLKARAIQAAEESQANNGIDHTLHTCDKTLFLDNYKRHDLSDAVYKQEEDLSSYSSKELGNEFRKLLDEYAPWYDKTSRKMIQACHRFLCTRGCTSSTVGLAIHFFEEEWARASSDEKTFCHEVSQE